MKRRPKQTPVEDSGGAPSATAAEAVLQIKVWLIGISPMVWRRVLVPAAFTLRELHGVIAGRGYGRTNPPLNIACNTLPYVFVRLRLQARPAAHSRRQQGGAGRADPPLYRDVQRRPGTPALALWHRFRAPAAGGMIRVANSRTQ